MNPSMPTADDGLATYPREREDYVNPASELQAGPPVRPLRCVGGSSGRLVTDT